VASDHGALGVFETANYLLRDESGIGPYAAEERRRHTVLETESDEEQSGRFGHDATTVARYAALVEYG
jgi:hypothetical protein